MPKPSLAWSLPVLICAWLGTSPLLLVTVRGLWAGPYLAEVFGMDAVARGNVLLLMSLGIVGGGQLGRMLALAAAPLGVQCRVLEPAGDPSAQENPMAWSGVQEQLPHDVHAVTTVDVMEERAHE